MKVAIGQFNAVVGDLDGNVEKMRQVYDRALKKNVDFHKLYNKPEGALKLAKITDKRPAVTVNKTAVDAFKDLPFPDKLE